MWVAVLAALALLDICGVPFSKGWPTQAQLQQQASVDGLTLTKRGVKAKTYKRSTDSNGEKMSSNWQKWNDKMGTTKEKNSERGIIGWIMYPFLMLIVFVGATVSCGADMFRDAFLGGSEVVDPMESAGLVDKPPVMEAGDGGEGGSDA